MNSHDLKVGLVIRHRQKPEWGLGKVLELDLTKAWIYFKDIKGTPKDAVRVISGAEHLERAGLQTDADLDNLPPLVHLGKIIAPAAFRLTQQQAIDVFVKRYRSFEDGEYLEHERNYKWNAHQQIKRQLPSLASASADDAADSLKEWIHLTNLLATQEIMALNDAFKEPGAALRYGQAVAAFVSAPAEPEFTRLSAATEGLPMRPGRARVFSWPTVTLLPYLADPSAAMFLKPSLTQRMARSCFFDLLYDSRPSWTTYTRLMMLSRHLLSVLMPLGAKDFIDVQSFMWVVAGSSAAEI
jgi:hypothetical protein